MYKSYLKQKLLISNIPLFNLCLGDFLIHTNTCVTTQNNKIPIFYKYVQSFWAIFVLDVFLLSHLHLCKGCPLLLLTDSHPPRSNFQVPYCIFCYFPIVNVTHEHISRVLIQRQCLISQFCGSEVWVTSVHTSEGCSFCPHLRRLDSRGQLAGFYLEMPVKKSLPVSFRFFQSFILLITGLWTSSPCWLSAGTLSWFLKTFLI